MDCTMLYLFYLSTLLFLLLLAAKPQKGPQPLRTAALHITLCGAAILLLSQSVNAYPLYMLRSFQAVHVVQHLALDFLLGVVIENVRTTKDVQIARCLIINIPAFPAIGKAFFFKREQRFK